MMGICAGLEGKKFQKLAVSVDVEKERGSIDGKNKVYDISFASQLISNREWNLQNSGVGSPQRTLHIGCIQMDQGRIVYIQSLHQEWPASESTSNAWPSFFPRSRPALSDNFHPPEKRPGAKKGGTPTNIKFRVVIENQLSLMVEFKATAISGWQPLKRPQFSKRHYAHSLTMTSTVVNIIKWSVTRPALQRLTSMVVPSVCTVWSSGTKNRNVTWRTTYYTIWYTHSHPQSMPKVTNQLPTNCLFACIWTYVYLL